MVYNITMFKLGAKELRLSKSDPEIKKVLKKNRVFIILDNVLDTYNIGAIFRLADAVSAEKVLICGQSETPPNSRIKKASINTTEWVDWEYYPDTQSAIKSLRDQIDGIKIYAVEQDSKSIPYDSINFTFPFALIAGHESDGVSPQALSQADNIIEIPMWGINKSLNVMVSLGIVLFEAMSKATKIK